MKGSKEKPFKLSIVGAGPAGVSIPIKALRLNLFKELCTETLGENQVSSAGLCIIDENTSHNFGAGKLHSYIINSNTFADKFVINIIEERSNWLPAESLDINDKNIIESLPSAIALTKLGATRCPLVKVGEYLKDIAQLVLAKLTIYPDSQVYFSSRVNSIQRVTVNKRLLWCIVMTQTISTTSTTTSTNATTIGCDKTVTIYTESVALSTGGIQRVPDIPLLTSLKPVDKAKVICSDYYCQQEGYDTIRTRLLSSVFKHVVIIGGSHSAFSCAWITINRLLKDLHISGSESGNTCGGGGGNKCYVYILHRSAIQVFYNTKQEADRDGYRDYKHINPHTGSIHAFGGIRGDAKQLWRSICIGTETRVKLIEMKGQSFLAKLCDDASLVIWAGGYHTNLPRILNEDNSEIKFKYDCSQVDIDLHGHLIEEKESVAEDPINRSLFRVSASLAVPGLLGIGLGYGVKSAEDGEHVRAGIHYLCTLYHTTMNIVFKLTIYMYMMLFYVLDGVAVYVKHQASLVLAAVLGKENVYGPDASSYEEYIAVNRERWRLMETTVGADSEGEGEGDSNSEVVVDFSALTVSSDNKAAPLPPTILKTSSPNRYASPRKQAVPTSPSSPTKSSSPNTKKPTSRVSGSKSTTPTKLIKAPPSPCITPTQQRNPTSTSQRSERAAIPPHTLVLPILPSSPINRKGVCTATAATTTTATTVGTSSAAQSVEEVGSSSGSDQLLHDISVTTIHLPPIQS